MRKLIKKILKEDDWDFVRDIKSNQDIAQEIADETKIKNNLLHTPFLRASPFSPLHLSLFYSSFSPFTKYCKEQYGLDNEDDINDIWERYEKLIEYRVNNININESDGWDFVRDVKSNQDIAQEIADETKIKNNLLHTPFLPHLPTSKFNLKLFSLSSPHPPHYTSHPSPFTKYCKEQYGLKKGDINDIWERYEKLIKYRVNNINESDDLQWIKDIKSHKDIAQEIADETKIKNDLLHTPFSRSPLPLSSPLFSLPSNPLLSSHLSSFTKYGKEQYGLDDDDVQYVWERYKKLVRDKVNNINESDDLQWLKDIPALVDITPGMCLRDQQGTQWITMNPNNYPKTDKNKWAWLLRTHTEGQKIIRRHPHPFKRVDLNDRLVVGDLSLCDNTLKESDDLQWIRDIEPYVTFEDARVGGSYGVQIMDRYLFEDVIDGCDDMIEGIPNFIIVNKKALLQYDDVYCVNRDSNVIPYWDGTKECLRLEFYSNQGSFLLDHWLAPDDLIRLFESDEGHS